jgi:ADP-ribose pyrophosphatase YjhB (NUDIX family)
VSTDARQYPSRPFVGVGAVVVGSDGRVLLVKRRNEPLAGRWSLPGGLVEVGESLEAAVRREVLEETGLDVGVGPLVEVVERVHRDADGGVEWHYVLLDYLCRPEAGAPAAASDAAEVAFVTPDELDDYGIAKATADVIRRGLTLATNASPAGTPPTSSASPDRATRSRLARR